MRRIAAECRLSTAALGSHYGSREHLLRVAGYTTSEGLLDHQRQMVAVHGLVGLRATRARRRRRRPGVAGVGELGRSHEALEQLVARHRAEQRRRWWPAATTTCWAARRSTACWPWSTGSRSPCATRSRPLPLPRVRTLFERHVRRSPARRGPCVAARGSCCAGGGRSVGHRVVMDGRAATCGVGGGRVRGLACARTSTRAGRSPSARPAAPVVDVRSVMGWSWTDERPLGCSTPRLASARSAGDRCSWSCVTRPLRRCPRLPPRRRWTFGRSSAGDGRRVSTPLFDTASAIRALCGCHVSLLCATRPLRRCPRLLLRRRWTFGRSSGGDGRTSVHLRSGGGVRGAGSRQAGRPVAAV